MSRKGSLDLTNVIDGGPFVEVCPLESVFGSVLFQINISSFFVDNYNLPGYECNFFTRDNIRGGAIAVFLSRAWFASVLSI